MSLKKIIHVITNDVTKQFVADTITAVGASPIMSETPEEYAFIYPKIHATVINLGMVNTEKQKVIHSACAHAKKQGVPMVLDLVGIHFSAYRKCFASELLNQYDFEVIKGNYDEISALNSKALSDSFEATQPITLDKLEPIASLYTKSVIVATGAVDYIAHKEEIHTISGGSSLLPRVSGTGCILSGLLGVCVAPAQGTQPIPLSTLSVPSKIKTLCDAYKQASVRAEVTAQNRLGQFKTDLISEISEIEVLL